MITGTITMSSPIILMAFQRCPSVGAFPDARRICRLTDTWSKSMPVNTRLTVVSSRSVRGAPRGRSCSLVSTWKRVTVVRPTVRCPRRRRRAARRLRGHCVGMCVLHNQRQND
jgi:hypothetical protein